MNETNGHENDEVEAPLPSAAPQQLSQNVSLQQPLSRRGFGPGLIILLPKDVNLDKDEKTLDPPPLQKWAEEGYAVVQVLVELGELAIRDDLEIACNTLLELNECQPKGKFGVICQ